MTTMDQYAAHFADEAAKLREALGQALRQWKMYAELEDDRDLKTEDSPEGELYRAALALAETR